jgi:hypothetical protein
MLLRKIHKKQSVTGKSDNRKQLNLLFLYRNLLNISIYKRKREGKC